MPTAQPQTPPFAVKPVVACALVVAAVLTALSGRYGFHRDEMYFVAAGKRLAWGYEDQPPLTPLLARTSTTLFGETPAGLRVVATLMCMATVVVAALVARELDGGRSAQLLTAAAVATSSVVLTNGHMLATSTSDTLTWLVLCWLVLRLVRTGNGRWYLAIGAAAGLGLQNKYIVVLLLGALPIALTLVGPRRVLRTWWLSAGVLVALVIAAPTLVWQATHGWPQLTVASGISDQNGVENRVTFIPFQFVYLSPPYAVLWLVGIWRLLRSPEMRWARALPVAYLLLVVLMLAAAGKPYYVMGLLITLLAAGAAPVVQWAAEGRLRGWVLPAMVAFVAVVNVAAALPVWPRNTLNPVNAVNKEQGEQVGWPDLVDSVAKVWQSMPAADRSRAVIFTQNYGEAAAIELYGLPHGLPQPYSGHMSYADWGTPPDSAGPVLLVRFPANDELGAEFTGCRVVDTVTSEYDVHNPEQGALIQLCGGPRQPWSVLWPRLRHFY